MNLKDYLNDAIRQIKDCNDLNSLLHDVKSSIFGKNSDFTKLLSTMKDF